MLVEKDSSIVLTEQSFSVKIKEYHTGIHILLNVHLRFAEFIHNTHNIPFVDKRGKPGSEVLFGQGHVVHLFPMQVIDEIFPYHALAVFQKILLAFAPHSRQLFAPLLHFPYFPLIGEAHQADEQIEKQLILFIQVDCFQRFDEVSVCQMGYGLAVRRLHAVLFVAARLPRLPHLFCGC